MKDTHISPLRASYDCLSRLSGVKVTARYRQCIVLQNILATQKLSEMKQPSEGMIKRNGVAMHLLAFLSLKGIEIYHRISCSISVHLMM